MASLGSYHESYQKVSVVRGHHIYKVVWTPEVGEILQVRTEDGNEHDEHAESSAMVWKYHVFIPSIPTLLRPLTN